MKKILLIILTFSLLTQCGIYRKTDARKIPGNVNDRVQKNLEEGKRIKFGGGGKKGSGNFSFATSNEMWRASLEILDFVPLSTVDYSGGIIINEWYSDSLDSKETIKIIINFLSNEIRADGLKVKTYKKICNDKLNCTTKRISTKINSEIKLAILKKAAQIKTADRKKRSKEEIGEYTIVPTD